MQNLLDYQQENFDRLKRALEETNNVVVIGPEHSGRNTVIDKLKEKDNVIIKIYPSCSNESCADLLHAIRNISSIDDERYFVKIGLEIAFLSISHESESLFPIEKKALRFLKKLLHQKNIFFVINNIEKIDVGTKGVIDELCNTTKKRFNKKIVKIVVSEAVCPEGFYPVEFKRLKYDKSSHEKILQDLGLENSIHLSRDVLEFILKNANGNIRILKKIVDDFNNNAIDTQLAVYDKNSTIKKLVASIIDDSEYKQELNDILNIVSISDTYFTSTDLSFLLNNESNLIELYLSYAEKCRLLTNENSIYKIIFGVISEIYSRVSDEKKIEIYNDIVDLMAAHHPKLYAEKYKFAKLANQKNASNFLVQHILSLIRENKCYLNNQDFFTLSNEERAIINCYKDAWCKSNTNSYRDAVKIIDTMFSLYPIASPVRQELQLLKSQSLIKSIDSFDRNEAVNILYYDPADGDIDEYLKYRLDTRKIAALIHNGKYREARSHSDHLISRIMSFVNKTNSPDMLYYLNIIYRKYCNTHPYESSIAHIEKSIEFFSKDKRYLKDTYIALNNALALNLINGDESKAKDNMQEIAKLKEENCTYNFPRGEMLENNKLIYDLVYTFNQKKIHVLKKYETLYEETKNTADNILIASNYSIVLALNNKVDAALNILKECYDTLKINGDMEGIYWYRIATNYAVCLFLGDNSKRNEALSLLNSIQLCKDDLHNKDRSRELYHIIETMGTIETCSSAVEWIKAYQQSIDTPRKYYRLYEYGFVFTTLFDWDDE